MSNYVFDGKYGPIPSEIGTVDLSNYAEKYVEDYENTEELPEENKKYLHEVFTNYYDYKVTNMYRMFNKCWKLKTVDVSDWHTCYVTNMFGLFNCCESLTSVDVSKWSTGNVTDMGLMFSCCASLKTLDLSKWITGRVDNMNCMFTYCKNISEISLSNFDTSHVTNMNGLFANCYSIRKLILTNWDTKNVKTAKWMFMNCAGLLYIYDFILDLSSCEDFESILSSSAISEINVKLPESVSEEEFKEIAYKTNKADIYFVK